MDRCPNCRARVSGQDECRRCGMDLRLLIATERAAETHLRMAVVRLANGDQAGAIAALRTACSLYRDPLAGQLLRACTQASAPAPPLPPAQTP